MRPGLPIFMILPAEKVAGATWADMGDRNGPNLFRA